MSLPQDIAPINPELMDTLFRTHDHPWIPMPDDPKRGFVKVLWTRSESGRWAALSRWLKG